MSDDKAYYQQRATEERQRATISSNRDVAEIHEELARQYEALASGFDNVHPIRTAVSRQSRLQA